MKKLNKNLNRLTTLRLVTILILSFGSFTASSQSTDSTLCFTPDQVKTFLRTKVELDQCLESNELLLTQYSQLEDQTLELQDQNKEITEKNIKLKKQRNRSRIITAGTGLLCVLSTVFFFMK